MSEVTTNADAVVAILDALGRPELVELRIGAVQPLAGPDVPAEPGRCFGNAVIVAARRDWQMVLGDLHPDSQLAHWTPHAWLADPDGQMWDPTALSPAWSRYRGVPVSLEEMWGAANRWRRCSATTRAGSPCSRWAIFPSEGCHQHDGWSMWWCD